MIFERMDDEILTVVNNDVKIYEFAGGFNHGSDSLLLSAYIRKTGGTAVEFGSGSGVISLLCGARHKFDVIYAVEVQQEYYPLAQKNVILNNLADVIHPVCADLREYKTKSPVDVIFTNPPYIKSRGGRPSADKRRLAARQEIFGNIKDFTGAAARILHHGGLFYAVYRPQRIADLICAMREDKIEPKRMTFVYEDKRYKPCFVLIEGRKGGKPEIVATPPLFIKENGRFTLEYEYIYENGEFDVKYL